MTNPATTYQPLGNFIRKVDNRNRDLKVKNLVGLTIEKAFIPSVANIIGTDLSNYKVIRKRQFACSLMQVSRDGKMPIAMFAEEEGIMSPAYPMFEVADEKVLLPEYLMMWFARSEFDREASYYAVGGVRGSLEWDDFCAMRIPVPPIAEQRAVVAEYAAVQHRMEVNKRLIAKLEETAQTLYKKMFVDGVDKENLPDGWRMGTLGEVCIIKAGGDAPEMVSEKPNDICQYPIYANGFENNGLYGYTDKPKITKPSITISARGTIGFCCIRKKPYVPIVRLIVIIPNNDELLNYLGLHFKMSRIEGDGSVQGQLTVPNVEEYNIAIPSDSDLLKFNKLYNTIDSEIEILEKEIEKLTDIQTLLLARMGR